MAVLELSSMGVHIGVQRRNREQKSFVEIKPVPVVEHMEIWQFIFAKVYVGTHIRSGGQGSKYLILLEI